MTHEEFATYWQEEHAPLVEALPGLERYAVRLPTDPERSSYDGVADLHFEDRDAMAAAFDSPAGEAVKADADAFVGGDVTLITEETVTYAGDDRGDADATEGA